MQRAPVQRSGGTCARCGDGVCAACLRAVDGGALCAACRARNEERRLELLGTERRLRALCICISALSVLRLLICVAIVVLALTGQKPRELLTTWGPVLPLPPAFFGYGIMLARARTSLRWPAVLASIGMLMVIPVRTLVCKLHRRFASRADPAASA